LIILCIQCVVLTLCFYIMSLIKNINHYAMTKSTVIHIKLNSNMLDENLLQVDKWGAFCLLIAKFFLHKSRFIFHL